MDIPPTEIHKIIIHTRGFCGNIEQISNPDKYNHLTIYNASWKCVFLFVFLSVPTTLHVQFMNMQMFFRSFSWFFVICPIYAVFHGFSCFVWFLAFFFSFLWFLRFSQFSAVVRGFLRYLISRPSDMGLLLVLLNLGAVHIWAHHRGTHSPFSKWWGLMRWGPTHPFTKDELIFSSRNVKKP